MSFDLHMQKDRNEVSENADLMPTSSHYTHSERLLRHFSEPELPARTMTAELNALNMELLQSSDDCLFDGNDTIQARSLSDCQNSANQFYQCASSNIHTSDKRKSERIVNSKNILTVSNNDFMSLLSHKEELIANEVRELKKYREAADGSGIPQQLPNYRSQNQSTAADFPSQTSRDFSSSLINPGLSKDFENVSTETSTINENNLLYISKTEVPPNEASRSLATSTATCRKVSSHVAVNSLPSRAAYQQFSSRDNKQKNTKSRTFDDCYENSSEESKDNFTGNSPIIKGHFIMEENKKLPLSHSVSLDQLDQDAIKNSKIPLQYQLHPTNIDISDPFMDSKQNSKKFLSVSDSRDDYKLQSGQEKTIDNGNFLYCRQRREPMGSEITEPSHSSKSHILTDKSSRTYRPVLPDSDSLNELPHAETSSNLSSHSQYKLPFQNMQSNACNLISGPLITSEIDEYQVMLKKLAHYQPETFHGQIGTDPVGGLLLKIPHNKDSKKHKQSSFNEMDDTLGSLIFIPSYNGADSLSFVQVPKSVIPNSESTNNQDSKCDELSDNVTSTKTPIYKDVSNKLIKASKAHSNILESNYPGSLDKTSDAEQSKIESIVSIINPTYSDDYTESENLGKDSISKTDISYFQTLVNQIAEKKDIKAVVRGLIVEIPSRHSSESRPLETNSSDSFMFLPTCDESSIFKSGNSPEENLEDISFNSNVLCNQPSETDSVTDPNLYLLPISNSSKNNHLKSDDVQFSHFYSNDNLSHKSDKSQQFQESLYGMNKNKINKYRSSNNHKHRPPLIGQSASQSGTEVINENVNDSIEVQYESLPHVKQYLIPSYSVGSKYSSDVEGFSDNALSSIASIESRDSLSQRVEALLGEHVKSSKNSRDSKDFRSLDSEATQQISEKNPSSEYADHYIDQNDDENQGEIEEDSDQEAVRSISEFTVSAESVTTVVFAPDNKEYTAEPSKTVHTACKIDKLDKKFSENSSSHFCNSEQKSGYHLEHDNLNRRYNQPENLSENNSNPQLVFSSKAKNYSPQCFFPSMPNQPRESGYINKPGNRFLFGYHPKSDVSDAEMEESGRSGCHSDYRTSPTSVSSMASSKRLEWDNGADLGYEAIIRTLSSIDNIFLRSEPEGISVFGKDALVGAKGQVQQPQTVNVGKNQRNRMGSISEETAGDKPHFIHNSGVYHDEYSKNKQVDQDTLLRNEVIVKKLIKLQSGTLLDNKQSMFVHVGIQTDMSCATKDVEVQTRLRNANSPSSSVGSFSSGNTVKKVSDKSPDKLMHLKEIKKHSSSPNESSRANEFYFQSGNCNTFHPMSSSLELPHDLLRQKPRSSSLPFVNYAGQHQYFPDVSSQTLDDHSSTSSSQITLEDSPINLMNQTEEAFNDHSNNQSIIKKAYLISDVFQQNNCEQKNSNSKHILVDINQDECYLSDFNNANNTLDDCNQNNNERIPFHITNFAHVDLQFPFSGILPSNLSSVVMLEDGENIYDQSNPSSDDVEAEEENIVNHEETIENRHISENSDCLKFRWYPMRERQSSQDIKHAATQTSVSFLAEHGNNGYDGYPEQDAEYYSENCDLYNIQDKAPSRNTLGSEDVFSTENLESASEKSDIQINWCKSRKQPHNVFVSKTHLCEDSVLPHQKMPNSVHYNENCARSDVHFTETERRDFLSGVETYLSDTSEQSSIELKDENSYSEASVIPSNNEEQIEIRYLPRYAPAGQVAESPIPSAVATTDNSIQQDLSTASSTTKTADNNMQNSFRTSQPSRNKLTRMYSKHSESEMTGENIDSSPDSTYTNDSKDSNPKIYQKKSTRWRSQGDDVASVTKNKLKTEESKDVPDLKRCLSSSVHNDKQNLNQSSQKKIEAVKRNSSSANGSELFSSVSHPYSGRSQILIRRDGPIGSSEEKPGMPSLSHTASKADAFPSLPNSETMESTHTGSDDAQPPEFPPEVLGSRSEPSVSGPGVYGLKKFKTKCVNENNQKIDEAQKTSNDSLELAAKSVGKAELLGSHDMINGYHQPDSKSNNFDGESPLKKKTVANITKNQNSETLHLSKSETIFNTYKSASFKSNSDSSQQKSFKEETRSIAQVSSEESTIQQTVNNNNVPAAVKKKTEKLFKELPRSENHSTEPAPSTTTDSSRRILKFTKRSKSYSRGKLSTTTHRELQRLKHLIDRQKKHYIQRLQMEVERLERLEELMLFQTLQLHTSISSTSITASSSHDQTDPKTLYYASSGQVYIKTPEPNVHSGKSSITGGTHSSNIFIQTNDISFPSSQTAFHKRMDKDSKSLNNAVPKRKTHLGYATDTSLHAENKKNFGQMYPSPHHSEDNFIQQHRFQMATIGVQTSDSLLLCTPSNSTERYFVTIDAPNKSKQTSSDKNKSKMFVRSHKYLKKASKEPGVAWYIPVDRDLHIPSENDSNAYNLEEITCTVNLQDAFHNHCPDLLQRSEARLAQLNELAKIQKRYNDIALKRAKLKQYVKDKGFQADFNDNAELKRKKIFTHKEMRKHTEKLYQNLNEVVDKKEKKRKEEQFKTNKLMADIYKKKLQEQVLKGKVNWTISQTCL